MKNVYSGFFLLRIFRLNIDFQTEFVNFPNKNLFTSHMYPADTDVFKTSSGRIIKVTTPYYQTRSRYDVWKKTSDLRRFEDVWFTTSWRLLIYDVFRTSGLQRPEDVWFKSSWRRPIWDVLKEYDLQRLQDVWFMTSWRRLVYDVLKTSVKRRLCSNVVVTSIQRRKKLFFFYFVLCEIFRKF